MIYIMYNKNANSGHAYDKAYKLMKKLSKKNIVKIEELVYEGLNDRISTFTSEDKLIIAGGDGTLHYFINSINQNSVKCHVFLLKDGSSNDFAKEFKGNLIEITNMIKNLPKFEINDKTEKFINGVGVGVDALICKIVNETNHQKSYFKNAIEAFKKYKPFDMDIIVDGSIYHYTNVLTCVCQNGKYFGHGMKIAPHAIREDEYLDVYIVHNIKPRKIINLLFLVFFGKHTIVKNSVNYFKCKTVKMISPAAGLYLQAEGEVEEFNGQIEIKR